MTFPLPLVPKLHCPESTHHFGTVFNDTQVRHEYVISNQGDAPLIVSRVKSCCGATVGISTNVISPGSNAVVHVTLKFDGKVGAIRKTIYVKSNDPQQPTYRLRLEGEAVEPVEVEEDDGEEGWEEVEGEEK